jgi:16S rRNA processing protein RimM
LSKNVVARVGRPHGVRGEVTVVSFSDDPQRFAPGAELDAGDRRLTVVSSRPHKNTLLVSFEGIEDRTAAETLRGVELTIAASDRRSLGDGEYWADDLIGLEARSTLGDTLGMVVDVVLGDSQDRIVIRTPAGDRTEVPFVDELVPNVDLVAGVVSINTISGLF